MERKHGCAGCLTILAVLAVIGLLSRSPDKSKSNPAQNTAPASAPSDPHEQHETHLDEPLSTPEPEPSAPAQHGETDPHPFVGPLSLYRKYAVTDQVSFGQWSYKLIRQAVLFPTVHGPHREFKPEIGGGLRLGDSNTEVRVIELAARNDADVSNTFPEITMISDSDSRAGELLEFHQFSAGYIDRHLDSSVVFGPGEQLRGVIAFECCLNPTADSQVFLRVPGQSGKSALISLSTPPPPPSHQVCTHIDATSPYSIGATTCRTVLDSDEPPPNPCSIPGVTCAPSKPAPTTSSDTPPAPASHPEIQAAPPTNASKPTSGVLCNWPVEVPQNGEVKFRNLPSDRLKFTFDHDAWLPRIHREPDGTQTLIMRSIKPGVQTICEIRWEIVQ